MVLRRRGMNCSLIVFYYILQEITKQRILFIADNVCKTYEKECMQTCIFIFMHFITCYNTCNCCFSALVNIYAVICVNPKYVKHSIFFSFMTICIFNRNFRVLVFVSVLWQYNYFINNEKLMYPSAIDSSNIIRMSI